MGPEAPKEFTIDLLCWLCWVQLWYIDQLLRLNPEENYKWAYTGVGVLPHDAGMRDALKAQVGGRKQ